MADQVIYNNTKTEAILIPRLKLKNKKICYPQFCPAVEDKYL